MCRIDHLLVETKICCKSIFLKKLQNKTKSSSPQSVCTFLHILIFSKGNLRECTKFMWPGGGAGFTLSASEKSITPPKSTQKKVRPPLNRFEKKYNITTLRKIST